jgi:hypothetical protein
MLMKHRSEVTAHRAPDLFGVFASLHDQPGLRMTYTLHQAACENLRHPSISYKHRGLLNQIVYPMSRYVQSTKEESLDSCLFRWWNNSEIAASQAR